MGKHDLKERVIKYYENHYKKGKAFTVNYYEDKGFSRSTIYSFLRDLDIDDSDTDTDTDTDTNTRKISRMEYEKRTVSYYSNQREKGSKCKKSIKRLN